MLAILCCAVSLFVLCRYSNIGLLEHYGFLLPENLHDEAVVPHELWPIVVDPSESQRFFFHPGEILHCPVPVMLNPYLLERPPRFRIAPFFSYRTRLDCGVPAHLQHVTVGGCPSWSLLQALRRNFCTPAERSCAANAVRGERISSRNEQQALECISEVCMQVCFGKL